MMMIAARSSTTAIVDSSSFIPTGTREPSSDRMPRANAMSVAAGIAQPCIAVASPRLIHQKIAAGTATPATAHSNGRINWSRLDSWPLRASRLISSATSRKNTAIRPSLIQSRSGLAMRRSPNCITTGSSRKPS